MQRTGDDGERSAEITIHKYVKSKYVREIRLQGVCKPKTEKRGRDGKKLFNIT